MSDQTEKEILLALHGLLDLRERTLLTYEDAYEAINLVLSGKVYHVPAIFVVEGNPVMEIAP